MAHSLWSDRPLGVTLEQAATTGQITENIGARAAIGEVARMSTSHHSSVARSRY